MRRRKPPKQKSKKIQKNLNKLKQRLKRETKSSPDSGLVQPNLNSISSGFGDTNPFNKIQKDENTKQDNAQISEIDQKKEIFSDNVEGNLQKNNNIDDNIIDEIKPSQSLFQDNTEKDNPNPSFLKSMKTPKPMLFNPDTPQDQQNSVENNDEPNQALFDVFGDENKEQATSPPDNLNSELLNSDPPIEKDFEEPIPLFGQEFISPSKENDFQTNLNPENQNQNKKDNENYNENYNENENKNIDEEENRPFLEDKLFDEPTSDDDSNSNQNFNSPNLSVGNTVFPKDNGNKLIQNDKMIGDMDRELKKRESFGSNKNLKKQLDPNILRNNLGNLDQVIDPKRNIQNKRVQHENENEDLEMLENLKRTDDPSDKNNNFSSQPQNNKISKDNNNTSQNNNGNLQDNLENGFESPQPEENEENDELKEEAELNQELDPQMGNFVDPEDDTGFIDFTEDMGNDINKTDDFPEGQQNETPDPEDNENINNIADDGSVIPVTSDSLGPLTKPNQLNQLNQSTKPDNPNLNPNLNPNPKPVVPLPKIPKKQNLWQIKATELLQNPVFRAERIVANRKQIVYDSKKAYKKTIIHDLEARGKNNLEKWYKIIEFYKYKDSVYPRKSLMFVKLTRKAEWQPIERNCTMPLFLKEDSGDLICYFCCFLCRI